MARHEADREDLLREATALVDRVELRVDGCPEAVVIGFRRNGCGSVFLGADPVFHFNSSHQLRRGYWQGSLLKAEQGRLVRMTRHRTETQVQLLSEAWDPRRTEEFLEAMVQQLASLSDHLRQGRYELVGQVSQKANLLDVCVDWLAACCHTRQAASRPHAE